MNSLDPRVVEFVLSKIDNGFIFEQFGLEFLGKLLGENFIPAGGIKDKGIDGLEYSYSPEGREKFIYQLSIEKGAKGKISRTIDTLQKNGITCKRLYYVTNRPVKNKFTLEEQFYDDYKINVQIFDIDWFKIHANENEATIRSFADFQDKHLHEYSKPGYAYEVTDLTTDPRVFVFLRQQWDSSQRKNRLDEVLADTLILFALEGTDSSKNILRTRNEMLVQINQLTRFDPKWLYPIIDKRLKKLSSKPRKIRRHSKENAYCLPYETRLEIQQRNIDDLALYEKFNKSTKALLRENLNEQDIKVKEPYKLLEQVFHDLFHQQGLEFANFVETGDGAHSVEKSLKDIIAKVVDGSNITPKNREVIKSTLLVTIRGIIYQGDNEQLEFLSRLSNTYRMLFLLQCEPNIATYFATMASRLHIYVDTSILIPALSEYFLGEPHRRYWNLLVSAKDAGVTLQVNDLIIEELASHFWITKQNYHEKYEGSEHLYLDEMSVIYIDEILIRAFFYAKINGHIETFEEFIETFVSWNLRHTGEELIEWLRVCFGIQYEERQNLNLTIDKEEENRLYEELKKHKPSKQQARNDAKQLLTIYAVRERNNEHSISGVYGYNTWWLTTDTISQKAFENISNKRNRKYLRSSPYIRADFLYNYISLAPSKKQVDKAYKEIFPTLLGVNISYHIPSDINTAIQGYIKKHETLRNAPRLGGILRNLSQELRSDSKLWTKENVILWLDQQKEEFLQ